MNRSAGFTLVEVLVALVVFAVGATLAAQLLQETSRQLVEVTQTQLETPLPAVRARLRADVQAARVAICHVNSMGDAERVVLWGHPAGTVEYRVVDRVLTRAVRGERRIPVLPGMVSWHCGNRGNLLWLQLIFRQRVLPRPPGGASLEPRWQVESLAFIPRGAGLGAGW